MSKQKENQAQYCSCCGCYIPNGYSVCPACGKVVSQIRFVIEEKKDDKEVSNGWFLDIDKLRFELGRIKDGGKIYEYVGCCGIKDEVINSDVYNGRVYDGGIQRGQTVILHKTKIEILWEEVQ